MQLSRWLIRAGLFAAMMCALPAWLLLPLPGQETSTTSPEVEQQPVPIAEPLPAISQPEPRPMFRPGERLVIVLPDSGEIPALPEPSIMASVDPTTSKSVTETDAPKPLAIPATALPLTEVPAATPSPWPGILRLAALAYLVGAVIAALPLLCGAFALARLRSQARPAPAHVQAIFDELRAGLRVRLFVAQGLGSPVCFGLFRPVVLLPEEMTTAATEELRWVFAHELDHLRRGDPWTNWWVNVSKALYHAVPWFWALRRDVLLTQEYLADAAAAAMGRVEDYAAFLVRLSGTPAGRRHPVGANAVRARKSELYRRVTMLLSAKDQTAPRLSRGWSIAVVCSTVGLAVVLSGVGFAQQDGTPVAQPATAALALTVAPPPPGTPVASERQIVIPLIGVAPFQAVPIRHSAIPFVPNVQADPLLLPIPNPAAIAPLPDPLTGAVGDPMPALERVDPAIFTLRDKITLLQIQIDIALAANGDDKEERIKALQAEIEKLAKELERMQKDQAQPGVNRRVIVNPPPAPVLTNTWVQAPRGVGGSGSFSVETRLGVLVDRVPPVLADQLDLPKDRGVVLSGVLKDSSADKAGLKTSDIVLEFAGKPVEANPAEFIRSVNAVKVGDKVDLVVLRKGKKETIKGVEVPEAKRNALVVPLEPNNVVPVPLRPGQPLNVIPPVPPIPPVVIARPILVPKPLQPGVIPGAPGQRSLQVQVRDDSFQIQAIEDGVQYLIEGGSKDGKPVPNHILIKEGDKAVEAESLDKVPEKHKERVKQLLDSVKFAK
jgi:beta-lactamase regulating signal transducer with metallopeptidase domain